nr:inclusion body protein [Chrysanthemum yellow edge associated virus 1]
MEHTMEAMMKQLQNNIKMKEESILAAKLKIQKDEQDLDKMKQMLTLFNTQTISEPSTSTQPPPQELKPQQPLQLPKQPTIKQKEAYDNNIIETLVNQSIQKETSWYVVFKGHHPGVYSNWAVVADQITGFPGASHKKYKTKEEAEKAYNTTWSNMVQAQNEKLTRDRVRLSPNYTTLGMIRSPKTDSPKYSLNEFQTSWREIVEYKEEYILRHFYPRKRRIIGPKAIVTPKASPQDAWRFFSLGLVDTLYIDPKRLSILEYFPENMQKAVQRYREKVSKENEIYLMCKTSYPIYSEDNVIMVPSVGLVQMGISNGVHPDKEEITIKQYEFQVYINSLLQTYYHSSTYGIGKEQNQYIKVDYSGKTHIIYSKCNSRPLGDFELRELARFEENFNTLQGFFNNANQDILQMLCSRLKTETPHHKCKLCMTPVAENQKEDPKEQDEDEPIVDNSSEE